MHNSDYKHLTLVIEKVKTQEGQTVLTMVWTHAYVIKNKGTFSKDFRRRELVPCINCATSDIYLVKADGKSQLYSL